MCFAAALLCFLAVCSPARAGDLSKRFDLTLERVLAGGPPLYDARLVLADLIPEPTRRFTEFHGDLSGRWAGALSEASRYRPEALRAVRRLMPELIAQQRADGLFGARFSRGSVGPEDMARLWGLGRLLASLVEYSRLTGDEAALDAARRLGDALVELAPRFNDPVVARRARQGWLARGYDCWTQNIEGLVALFTATGERRYLEAARSIADRVERFPGQHNHGWLTSLRGAARLAESAEDAKLLRQVESRWEEFSRSKSLLLGGAVAEYHEPRPARDEGCATSDWLRLNLLLWRLTRGPRYLEEAERTLFNGFSMGQFASGDFGHFNLSVRGLGFGLTRAWWCCTLHGLRAFPAVLDAVFREVGGGLAYDLPVDGRGAADGFRLTAESLLSSSGHVLLRVTEADSSRHALLVRKPAWAEALRLSIDGAEQQPDLEDGYLRLDRLWRAGETVRLDYEFAARAAGGANGDTLVSVLVGPWLLAVSESASPSYFDEPYEHNRVLFPRTGLAGGLGPLADSGSPGAFDVPVARLAVRFIPGGYRDQPGDLILRPAAEHTSRPRAMRWDFRFPLSSRDGSKNPVRTELSGRADRSAIAAASALVLLVAGVFALRRFRNRRRPPETTGIEPRP